MEASEIARVKPAIQSAFELVKSMLQEGRIQVAAGSVFGAAVTWGEELKDIYAGEGRAELFARDPLTRFFVLRFRGLPEPADFADAPPADMFLIAFTVFPYLDPLMDACEVGDLAGFDEDGDYLVKVLVAGEDEHILMPVGRGGMGWRFDLMALYRTKSAALAGFIRDEFDGDFDAFFAHYLAEHDLDFELDRAWRPLGT